MDSVTFCGKTCHTVMQPEYTAYQNSPHSRVECVKCHIGPGAAWFVQSKLSGVGQVFAVTFNTYPRPIPTPVHNLRPARETCEACHWPQKYGEDRFRVISKFADDESQHRNQDRAADEDRRGQRRHRHPRHAPGPGSPDPLRPLRRSAPDHSLGGIRRQRTQDAVYAAADAKPDGAGLDRCARWTAWIATTARRTPSICRSARWTGPWRRARFRPRCPSPRRKPLEILKAAYRTREEAAQRIPAAFAQFYQESYPAVWNAQAGRSIGCRQEPSWRSTTATSSPK